MLNIFNATNMYITSDNHFFHGRIIKYCDRNYNWESDEDILRMNEDMLKEFDKLPDTPDTVVWNLGDLAFSKLITTNPDAFSLLKDIVSRMKGKHRTLCYVIGNHDKDVFRMVRKYTHSKNICDFFEKLGFDYVYNKPLLFDENIILSHEPVYMVPDSNFVNIHGHTHNTNVDEKYFKVDMENYEMNLKAARKNGITELPVDLEKWPTKNIDTSKYINVCLDANEMKILDFKKILKSLN